MKLTLVVPVYNASRYLLEFLSSLKKALGDFLVEVIFVVEPSDDDSLWLIGEETKDIPNCRIIQNKTRLGALGSRIAGIKEASGEYICFSDADDLMLPSYFSNILEEINPEYDLIDFGFEIQNKKIKKHNHKDEILEARKAKESLLLDIKIRSFLWNKVFKRELLLKVIDLELPNLPIYEDLVLVYSYLDFASKVKLSSKAIYRYNMHLDSLTGISKQRVSSRVRAYAYIYKYNETGDSKLNSIFRKYFYLLKCFILYDCKKEKLNRASKAKYLKQFKNLVRKGETNEIL